MIRLVLTCVCCFTFTVKAATPVISHLEWAKKNQSRMAYGLFMKDQKVGWTIDEMKLGKRNDKPVLISTSETLLQTLFDGEKSIKQEKTTTTYDLTGKGEIVFVELTRREDGKELSRRIERVKDKLKIQTQQGGRVLTREVPIPRDTIEHHRKLEEWLSAPRRRGDRFTKYAASWDEAEVDSKQVFEFLGSKAITFENAATRAIHVKIDLDGGTLDAEVLPDARILKGTLGGLLTMKLEKEAVAKKLGKQLLDLMPVTSITVSVDLGRARDVDRLKLKVQGLGSFKIPESHRQRITEAKDHVVLELRRDYLVKENEPLSEKQRAFYLRSTPRIQCDQEAIKRLAKKIVGEEKESLNLVRKIETWVYRNLKKSYSDNSDTSLEVLDAKAGDCTEHSLLFVALCRAAGLPAREVGGLAYSPGDKPAFGWHAWAEIHNGRQWITVDPTWHQIFVDATHLKMSTGDRDLAWTNVIGSLKLDVLEVQTRR